MIVFQFYPVCNFEILDLALSDLKGLINVRVQRIYASPYLINVTPCRSLGRRVVAD